MRLKKKAQTLGLTFHRGSHFLLIRCYRAIRPNPDGQQYGSKKWERNCEIKRSDISANHQPRKGDFVCVSQRFSRLDSELVDFLEGDS